MFPWWLTWQKVKDKKVGSLADGWPHDRNHEVHKMEAPSMITMTMINHTDGYDNDDNDVDDYNDDIDDDNVDTNKIIWDQCSTGHQKLS